MEMSQLMKKLNHIQLFLEKISLLTEKQHQKLNVKTFRYITSQTVQHSDEYFSKSQTNNGWFIRV